MALARFLSVSKALSDRTRVRALMALEDGELCLCQLVGLLMLAPSTLSKHMNILIASGLVTKYKHGRWHYFRLAGAEAPADIRRALQAATTALDGDPDIAADRKRTKSIRREDLEQLATCYRT